MTQAVVMFSGGAASFCSAKRAVERYGADEVLLLFADVGEEDDSTYRAVQEGARLLGCELEWLSGQSVWQLFFDQGMIGKPGAGLCSRILKRERCRAWLREHHPETLVVIGLTWEEMHRIEAPRGFWAPHPVWFPMTEDPWLTKDQQILEMRRSGVPIPDLYQLGGFLHNNCGGACVKAGQGQWLRLLEVRPEVFERWEQNEQQFRHVTGKDVSILRDRRGGPVKPLTLQALRERAERGKIQQADLFEGGGGCGCFTDDEEP